MIHTNFGGKLRISWISDWLVQLEKEKKIKTMNKFKLDTHRKLVSSN
jgi:hypothetical protein